MRTGNTSAQKIWTAILGTCAVLMGLGMIVIFVRHGLPDVRAGLFVAMPIFPILVIREQSRASQPGDSPYRAQGFGFLKVLCILMTAVTMAGAFL